MPQTTTSTARNVRAEIARYGTTQSALAKVLGLSHQSVSRRMRGLTPFRDRELQLIADHLGVPISALFGSTAA